MRYPKPILNKIQVDDIIRFKNGVEAKIVKAENEEIHYFIQSSGVYKIEKDDSFKVINPEYYARNNYIKEGLYYLGGE